MQGTWTHSHTHADTWYQSNCSHCYYHQVQCQGICNLNYILGIFHMIQKHPLVRLNRLLIGTLKAISPLELQTPPATWVRTGMSRSNGFVWNDLISKMAGVPSHFLTLRCQLVPRFQPRKRILQSENKQKHMAVIYDEFSIKINTWQCANLAIFTFQVP